MTLRLQALVFTSAGACICSDPALLVTCMSGARALRSCTSQSCKSTAGTVTECLFRDSLRACLLLRPCRMRLSSMLHVFRGLPNWEWMWPCGFRLGGLERPLLLHVPVRVRARQRPARLPLPVCNRRRLPDRDLRWLCASAYRCYTFLPAREGKSS